MARGARTKRGGPTRRGGRPARRGGEESELVVFLGPSLPVKEARAIAPCLVLPPARQGDVWRALAGRPVAMALVDGVFEHQPSVWHHELLAALDDGVAVFGGASMGALRAAELSRFGMVGVGEVFRWYRDGVVADDAEVALLHAGEEHGHRALTVPLVNVRHAAARAVEDEVISDHEAKLLVEEAARTFYQDRTWPRLLEAVTPKWRPFAHVRFEAWAAGELEDLKAQDARACIRAAAEYVAAHRQHRAPASAAPSGPPSSLVRRRRILAGTSAPRPGTAVGARRVLERLSERADAEVMARGGLRRALIAGWARSLGLSATAEERARAEKAWLESRGGSERERDALLAASGLDEGEAARLFEEVALEEIALEHASRLVPDGPSWIEGLAAEARLEGVWAEEARRAARDAGGGAAGPRRGGAGRGGAGRAGAARRGRGAARARPT
jgi:hypothetical protein